jgi:hypothetical protein
VLVHTGLGLGAWSIFESSFGIANLSPGDAARASRFRATRRIDVKTVLALVALAGAASVSLADFERAELAGHIYIDAVSGIQYNSPLDNEFVGTVHDNTLNAANAAFSSTNLANIWGDDWIGAGAGIVDSVTIGIFNSSSASGSLQSCKVQINFWDDTDATGATLLGNQGGIISNTIDFSGGVIGGGLGKSNYVLITFSNLASFGINLLDTYNIVTQQYSNVVGSNRLGIVSLGVATVGTSFADFYQSPGSAGAGFYTSGTTHVGLANKTTVIPAPGALAMLGLGGLVAGRRRR